MERAEVAGPFFVSMGKPEQLTEFLNKNPTVPRDQAFVDTSEKQDAYAALNFRPDFEGGKELDSNGNTVGLKTLNRVDWMGYLGSVAGLSPKPAEGEQFPEGVKKQGGTFVLQGRDKIAFASADRIPGDDPAVNVVLRSIGA